jgi:hypothetical protein
LPNQSFMITLIIDTLIENLISARYDVCFLPVLMTAFKVAILLSILIELKLSTDRHIAQLLVRG